MGLLKDFFEGGEEGVLRRCNTIIDLAIRANKEIGNIESSKDISKIREIEKNSDDVVFTITSLVTSGGVAPNLIDDMLQLIDKEDSIVDSIYNLARELLRYNIPEKAVASTVAKKIGEMNIIADTALKLLRKIQANDNIVEIKGLRKQIELLEEKGDEIKDSLFDYAYSSKLSFKSFYHIFELAHKADDILDNCEDASDMYLTIVSSIIT